MSSLPPPPIQVGNMDPVWQRWFRGLYARIGGTNGRVVVIRDDGTTASGLDEIEERLAALPERPDTAALEARIADLEAHLAGLTVPTPAPLEARIADLESQMAGLTVPSSASLEARVADIESEVASLSAPGRAEILQRIDDLAQES